MNNLTKTSKITKNLILNELTRIVVDHSIVIEEEKLEQKINLLFEDAKHITAERFLANCEIIRKQELYGKLPANYKFVDPSPKEEDRSNYYDYLLGKKGITQQQKPQSSGSYLDTLLGGKK